MDNNCIFLRSAVLTEVMREEEGPVSVHLSLAEEIQMLVSAEMITSTLPITHLTPDTTEEENQVKSFSFLVYYVDLTYNIKCLKLPTIWQPCSDHTFVSLQTHTLLVTEIHETVYRKGLMLRSCWTLKVSQRTVKLKGTSALNHEHFVISALRCFCIWFFCLVSYHNDLLSSSCRFACTVGTVVYGARLFLQCFFMFSFIVLIVVGCCAGHLLSISNMQNTARLMLQPYFSLHYDALPPVWLHANVLLQFKSSTAWCWSLFCL